MANARDKPGTRTLSQKLFDKILSIDIMLFMASSIDVVAIVGGKVDISATGPISLSNWNSFNGSFIIAWPFGIEDPSPRDKSPSFFISGSASLGRGAAGSLVDVGGSTRILMRARKKPL